MIPERSRGSQVALLLVVLLAAIAGHAEAQKSAKLTATGSSCASKLRCNTCIQVEGCVWCQQPDFKGQSRCYHNASQLCPEAFIYNPESKAEILLDEQLTAAGSAASSSSFSQSSQGSYSGSGSQHASGKIVQIQPQSLRLQLRVNEKYKLKVSYSQAVGYPVDLYYLMDLSKSMEDDKEKLSKLGNKLSIAMKNITSNFRLGFGSFVDKVLMPYVSTIQKNLREPCTNCTATYGFRHSLRLTENDTYFTTEVSAAQVSGNLDAPEGGFDAIMQAIACRSQIGWRDSARRLLVFSTDAGFHYAGDGKLGGVIAPNDGECHLNSRGEYTHSIYQDYPSISQINQKVKDNAINIIFAVTANQLSVYEKLVEHIQGSSAAQLDSDSSNVVTLVKSEYAKISSSVEMKDNATGDVKITYFSSCLNGHEEVQTAKCENLTQDKLVTFTAHIQLLKCPEDPRDWRQTIHISPVGINEVMEIQLEMLCSCPCENPASPTYEKNSDSCNKHGTSMCGICQCDDSHFGNKCECSATDINSKNANDASCRPDNTTLTDCSGRGNCVCGTCECHKRPNPQEEVSGKFCECDNFSCERNKNQLCSGKDHGICECGQCKCKQGWGGTNCACQESNHTCAPPGGGELCSGHGTCECGTCKCNANEQGRFSGRFCEKCPTCSGKCQELKECVQCQMYKTGVLKKPEDCSRNCSHFVPVGVEKLEIDESKDEQMCTFFDEDDCKFMFKYSEVQGVGLTVHAQETKECPPKVFMLGIVLGVIAAIVLVGLAILLLWKLLTTIHDRREFARFEKERMNAKWDTGENPIYKQATSTFKNPMYAGK
ncbi:integrin beta-PS isoform X2 [Drosophila biarmipes]|uniref:integrin beta-PS isoform X2 n=1 Tax=Drosophila biarmipes TaxID=125945 RepID=UPI0007E67427|nr:integrin beta-PS isoform X2 [Drosophila biarmipes]